MAAETDNTLTGSNVDTNTNEETKPMKKYTKPGKFDDIARYSQEIISSNEAFDGIRLEYQGPIGPIQTSHTFHLGNTEETPPYVLTSIYPRGNFTFVGKYDSDVKLFARSIYQRSIFTNTFAFQITKDKNVYLAGDAEFNIKSSNLYLKYDIQRNFTVNLFQALTKKWALGGEFTSVPSQQANIFSLGLRHKNKGTTFSGVLTSMNTFNLNFFRKKDNLELASEFAVATHPNTGALVSKTTLGVRYSFHASLFKIRADTDGSITGIYEEILGGFARFCVCASLNYFSNDYKIGLGIHFNK